MKVFILSLISIIFLLNSLALHAQEPVYRQFTNEDGLPSSEVYDVLQDNKGYMWFSTDQGLARYDGYRFTIFDESKGLPENTVFDLELDSKGRIWVNSIKGHFAYFDGTKIVAYPFNHKLDSFLTQHNISLRLYDTYHVFPSDSLVINHPTHGHIQINSKGNFTALKPFQKDTTYAFYLLDSNKVLFQGTSSEEERHKYLLHTDQGVSRFELSWQVFNNFRNYFRAFHLQNRLFFSVNQTLYELDPHGHIKQSRTFKSSILALNGDASGTILVGTAAHGVFQFSDFNLSSEPNNFLKRLSVSAFAYDHEGGLWITSLNKGVYYIPIKNSIFFNRHTDHDFQKVKDIYIDPNENCWLALTRGRIGKLTKNNAIEIIELDKENVFEINDILFHEPTQSLLIATTYEFYTLKERPLKPNSNQNISRFNITAIPAINSTLDIYMDHSDNLWTGRFGGLYKHKPNLEEAFSSRSLDNFIVRIEDITLINDTVYFATLNGLMSYYNGAYTHLKNKFPLLENRITKVFAINDTLFIGTKANGLLRLVNNKLTRFDKSKGLVSNSIRTIGANQTYLIIGTNQGISLITRKQLMNNANFKSYTANSGLHASEINAIGSLHDYFYLATSNGLQIIHPDELLMPDVQTPIYITNLQVNHKEREIVDQLSIPYSKNNIRIDYFAISYRNKGKQTYRHRLIGLENEWIVSQQTSSQYPFLPSGDYIYEVSAMNGRGEWNTNPVRLEITILKPFWAKTWFTILLGLTMLGLIMLFFYWHIQRIKKRNQLIYDINWYQQEALINQMNPHFLFNSLNTVHRYVLQNDRMASSRYLTKFATLMRKILDNSQELSISIAKEAEALNLYLELESARFKDRFEFEVKVDATISAEEVKIPVFIIQPIVENAIWHGLMNSDTSGMIEISFEREAATDLKVRISDNGIGREQADKIRKSTHSDGRKSLGINIIKRRIVLINSQEKTNITLTYNDLKAPDGSSSGTEVIVYFPYFLKSFTT
jgi:ligand-binding sensor domain-containing protein/two-component sensor histidine kinase